MKQRTDSLIEDLNSEEMVARASLGLVRYFVKL